MAHFLIRATYTQAGIQGVLKDGGSGRMKAITALAESLGGSVESAYWAFGGDDVYITCDLPGNVEAAALAATVGASGSAALQTVVLLTADEMDAAVKLHPSYRAPGA